MNWQELIFTAIKSFAMRLLPIFSGPIGWLARFFLDFFLKKLWLFLKTIFEILKRRKEIKQEARDSVQPLKDAKTAEEIDRATDSALDKL